MADAQDDWTSVASTGVDDWKSVTPKTWSETALDVAKQLPSGVVRGVEALPGAIPSALGAIGHGVEYGIRSLGLETPEVAESIRQREDLGKQIEAARAKNPRPSPSSFLPQPETTAGQYANTVGEFLPAALAGPGSLGRRILTQDVVPAVTSETAGQVTKGTALEPAARVIGAVTGAAGAMGTARALESAVSPATNVSADLARALMRDGDTVETLGSRLTQARQIRPNATVADVGGENVRGLVERVAQTPGAGRTTVVPALTQRQQAQAIRLSGDLSSLTGARQSAFDATQETMAARAQAATPLYRTALDDGDKALWSPELERLSSSPTVRAAMQGAVRIWRDNAIADGYGAMNPGALVDRGGQLSFLSGRVPVFPNLQFWDYTKRILDDKVSAALRAGQNQKARALTALTRNLRGDLDSQVPSYAAAREAWGGPSQYLDAIEEGRSILSKNITSEELAANLAEMTEAQREGYRIGAVSSIRSKMGGDAAKLGDMTKYIRSPEMRAKIAAMMPTPEAAESFSRRLDYEIRSSELAGRAMGNSATARRLAERQDADSIVGDLVMGALAHGPTMGLLHRTLLTIPNRVRDTLRSRADAILADILVNPRVSPQNAQFIPAIQQGLQGRARSPAALLPATIASQVNRPPWLSDAQGNRYSRGGSVKRLYSTHRLVRKFKARKAPDGKWYCKPNGSDQWHRLDLR